MKKLIVLCLLLLLIWLWFFDTKTTIYQVKKGATIHSIANDLKTQGIINSTTALILLAKIKHTIPKAGYYDFKNINNFLNDIHNNKVKTALITLIPGKSIQEYYKQLKHTKFIQTTRSLEQIMQELNIPKPYQGWFLPQTYQVNYGDNAKNILKQSYNLMQKKLIDFRKTKFIDTKYKLLILASIIEKESGNPAEGAIIAGVFINRLNKNMRLQSDATTIYGLGNRYNGNLTKENLREKNRYNTYKIKGLPIGAITNPSLNSIIAANNPAKHDFLYFVAKNSKEHIFAKTYKEHRENIKKYILKGQ